ncbi:MAG: hypothetical protein ACLQSR_08825 [Limisphaerales bacterium]
MNEPFVPLNKSVPSNQGRSDFRVSIVSQADGARPFQALGHNAAKPGGAPCEPRVTLQRDGSRVTAIRVQCSCGQVLELACVY